MSIFVFQLFSKNDKDDNVVSGGKYDVVIRQTSTERDGWRNEGEEERETIDNEWKRKKNADMSLLVRFRINKSLFLRFHCVTKDFPSSILFN